MQGKRPLDIPATISGLAPLADQMEQSVIRLWNEAGSQCHADLRIIQLGIPRMIRMFTERMRLQPATVEETRFWRRTHSYGDQHLIWTGMGKPNPQCDWTTDGEIRRTTPARVAWMLLRGRDIPPDRHLSKKCDVDRCISPDCHELASDYGSRPSLSRVRKDVLSDGAGGYLHARCGSPLRSLPKPGRRAYCSVCYQEDKRLLAAAESVRLARYLEQTGVQPPIEHITRTVSGQDLLEDADMLEPQPYPETQAARRNYQAEIDALFEEGKRFEESRRL